MERVLTALNEEFCGEIRCDELMVSHTSWRIGGPAQLFLIPQDKKDLQTLLQVLERFQVPWMVLGNGTNLLVKDGGIVGAVISLERFVSIELKILGRIQVDAGVSLSKLIQHAAVNGLRGLEELAGIPGTVGGALVMNAGAGEMEIGSLVESLTLVDASGEKFLDCEDANFEYRGSALSGRAVITSAILKLQRAKTEDDEENETLRSHGKRLGGAHAGSVFKNPPGQNAWELIDAAGLSGERCGDAIISEEHCNHIVNQGHATAVDVLSLIDTVRHRVLEQSGVELELEVHVAGQEVQL